MVSRQGMLLLAFAILGSFSVGSADITDMIGEAICAAQCLSNFTMSLDEPERSFLSQRPDLTEGHCLSKRSNCSLCLEVCRWSIQNTSSCEQSCHNLDKGAFQMAPHSPIGVNHTTCLDACTFAYNNRREREALVNGLRPASCPLPSSWPDGSTCQPHQRCTTDTDCGHSVFAKCCRIDACHAEHHPLPPPASLLYRLARGGGPSRLQGSLPSTGFCMRIGNDTAFAYRGVPPVPGQPSMRQTVPSSGDQEIYTLELDWPDYYNTVTSADSPEWTYPAVFLVQVRLFRDLGNSLFGDQGEFGDEMLQEELFSEWRSLVWTTQVGAVLSDLNPEMWYQFRLKAASGAGFGGNGRPSRPIKVMTLPGSPRNLTESSARIFSNKVEVKIHWEPPVNGNTSIKFYRVSWRKNASLNQEDSSLGDYETKVPRTVLTYTLQDLQPATVYEVQVTAVAIVDGKEWSSRPATLSITTLPTPSREYLQGLVNYYYNAEGRSCKCGSSPENQNFIKTVFFEDGILKARLVIPHNLLARYFGPAVKDTSIFHLLWYPQVCIETQNPHLGVSNAPASINVYTAALAGMDLDNLKFQCHYKLQVRMSEDPPQTTSRKSLDLCFCTPSCTQVPVKAGSGPRNCSLTDVLIPQRPFDVSYRLFPTKTKQWHPATSGEVALASQSEAEPVFPVRSAFKTGLNQHPGFDAIIFWKPHPETVVTTDGTARYTNYAESVVQPFPAAAPQPRGYRVTWGPRLIEPIEPVMYSNGIAPQLDLERTESKVVDSKVHNVILRNLEPNTLYIVQVQTIGSHGDSPVNAVFFTTPSLWDNGDVDASCSLRSSWVACSALASFCLVRYYVLSP